MPKSKRTKLISLTKTKSKGRERKSAMMTALQESVDTYDRVFLLSFENMRTRHFKNLRTQLSDSRFFLGNNRVMAIALGRTPEEAYAENLHKFSALLTGQTGVMFSNRTVDEVRRFFRDNAVKEYCRAGSEASDTVELKAGPLETFSHTMHEPFRKLGLPVVLKRGVVVLESDFTICNAGNKVTPEQARLLQHFGHKLAVFSVGVQAAWHDGKLERFGPQDME